MDYLEEFEARYKIPLSELAFNERLFTDFNEFYQFSSNEILSIVEQECRTFEKIIDQVKPNFIIMNKPYFHHEMIFYKLCKSKGIKVLDSRPTNYSKMGVLSFEDELENYTNFHPKKPSRTFDEMREFHKKYHIFKQNYAYRKEFQSSKKDLFNAAVKFLFSQGIENSKTHYTYLGRNRLNVLTNNILNSLKHQAKHDKEIIVYENIKRSLIDIDDVVKITIYIIEKKFNKKTINIANPQMYPIIDIINNLERVVKKKAIYQFLDKGDKKFSINCKNIKSAMKKLKINFNKFYLYKILKKYY